MLTIWGRENSNNVKKVRWCAAELGLNYTHINAGGAYGKVNEEPYRSLNPNGLVPLLQDGDFVLWESNTIVRYLAAKFGQTPFYPQDLRLALRQKMDGLEYLNHHRPFPQRVLGHGSHSARKA